MKFFLALPLLLLLFGSSKESTLSLKRPIRGLNTTLQTNFNGTYERKNPCTNADAETSSYVASHEFRHHINEDNWSDYTHKCSAIISSFLQGIGNLVRFNSKQNGTFNFHINTSISQKQDGHCDGKPCNTLPTIVIEANSCEVPPPCIPSSKGQNNRKQLIAQGRITEDGRQIPAKIRPKTLATLKPLENYSATTRYPSEKKSTWTPLHDARVQYQTLNDELENQENPQKNQRCIPTNDESATENYTPLPEYPRFSTQAGIRETNGFFNDFSQTTPQQSELLDISTTQYEDGTVYSDKKTTTDLEASPRNRNRQNTFGLENSEYLTSPTTPWQGFTEESSTPETSNFPYYGPQTIPKFETTPPPTFVNDEKLINNQYQPSRVSEKQILGQEIPDYQVNKPFSNQQPPFNPSPFENESRQVKKPFKYQEPLDVEEQSEPDFRAPANYDEEILPQERFQPAGLSDLPPNPNSLGRDENRSFASDREEFLSQQQTQPIRDIDDAFINTTPYPIPVRQSQEMPDIVDQIRSKKPVIESTTQSDSFSFSNQPETFYPFQNTEEYDEPIANPPTAKDFYPRPQPTKVPPVTQFPDKQKTSSYPTQTIKVEEEYNESTAKPLEAENFYLKEQQNTVPPPMQYPNQPVTSYPTQVLEEYDEPITKTPVVEEFYSRPQPKRVSPLTQYPEQPETSYSNQATDKYDEPNMNPPEVEDFYPKTQATTALPVMQYPNQPETAYPTKATDVEEYDETTIKPSEAENFYPDTKRTKIPPIKPSKVTPFPDYDTKEFLSPSSPVGDYSEQLPTTPLPFSEVSTNRPTNPEVTYSSEADQQTDIPFKDRYYETSTTDSFRPLEENYQTFPSTERPVIEQPFSRESLPEDMMTSDRPMILSPDSRIGKSEREQQQIEFKDSYVEEKIPPNYGSSPRPEFYDEQPEPEPEFTENPPLDYPNQIPPPLSTPDNQPPNDFKPQPNETPFYLQPDQRSKSQTYSDDYETTLPPDSFSPQSKQTTVDYTEEKSFSESDRNLDSRYPETPVPTPEDYQNSFSRPPVQPFKEVYIPANKESLPDSLTKYSPEQFAPGPIGKLPSYSDDYLTTASPKVSGTDLPEETYDDFYPPVSNKLRKHQKTSSKIPYDESSVDQSNRFTTISPLESFTAYDSQSEPLVQEEPILPTPDEKIFVKNQTPPSLSLRNDDSFTEDEPFLNEETIPDYTSSRYNEESNDYREPEPFLVPTKQSTNDRTEEFESFTTPLAPETYLEDDFYRSDKSSTFKSSPQPPKNFEPTPYSEASFQGEIYDNQNQPSSSPEKYSSAPSDEQVIDSTKDYQQPVNKMRYQPDMRDIEQEFSGVPNLQPFEGSQTTSFYESEYEPSVRPVTEKANLNQQTRTFDRTLKPNSEDYPAELFQTTQSSQTQGFTESTKPQAQSLLTYSNAQSDLSKSESMDITESTPQPEADLPYWTHGPADLASEPQPLPTTNPLTEDITAPTPDYQFTTTPPPETPDYPSPLDYYDDETPDRYSQPPLMPTDTTISPPRPTKPLPTPPTSYQEYTPADESFMSETITPIPQTSSYFESQEKMRDYSPAEPQPQPSYDNFADIPGDNTRLLASRTYENPKTANQYRGTPFQKFIDTREPSNFRKTPNPQFQERDRQSSDEFATTPTPFSVPDIPSYRTPPSSDFITDEYERENTGAQETLMFDDNVSPQPQPNTAVKYDEDMLTAQYQTSPASNPQPQTTLNYANQFYDDNISGELPEFYENQQRLLNSEPDFYSEVGTTASAATSATASTAAAATASAATTATASAATSTATSATASTATAATASTATAATASTATAATASTATAATASTATASTATASAATSTATASTATASAATSTATASTATATAASSTATASTATASAATSTGTASTATATAATSTATASAATSTATASTATASAATSMEQTPNFDDFESFPENEMTEEFSPVPSAENYQQTTDNFESDTLATDYPIDETQQPPLNNPNFESRESFLPYSNKLRSQPVYQTPISPEENFENQEEREFSQSQSEGLNNDHSQSFNPYNEPSSRIPDNSESLAPPIMQPQPMPGDYRNDFYDYDSMSRSSEREPAQPDDHRPLPDSQVPPEQFYYPDQNMNYNARELQRPAPQEYQRLSKPGFPQSFEPRRPFSPRKQPNFPNTQMRYMTGFQPNTYNRRPYGPSNTNFEPRTFRQNPMNNPQQAEPFFEEGIPSNASYADYGQRGLRPFPGQDYAEYDQVFPNQQPRQNHEYDEIIPRNSQKIGGRPQFERRRPEEIEQQYFEEELPQRPMKHTPNREPLAYSPVEHSNPLLHSLESQMSVPLQESPLPAMPNYQNDSTGPRVWDLPPHQQDDINSPQPESQLASDLTGPSNNPGENHVSCCTHYNRAPLLCPFDPALKGNMTAPYYYILISKLPANSNGCEQYEVEKVYLGDGTPLNCDINPDRTTNGRFNYMDRPLRKPFHEDRMKPVSTPERL